MAKERIKPELPGGFRDYLPEDMIPRQEMLDKIRFIFERFGFVPLDTPSIERTELLTGGDKEFNKQIYKIASNKENQKLSDLALRFDLTIPLARVVAANPEIKKPFKRYQMGKVFRAESSQAGRYNEFMQCDADIVGTDSSMSDAEIIALVYETLTTLGIDNFVIKINDREILNEVFSNVGIPEDKYDFVLRAIDKLDKIGEKEVKKQLIELIGEEQTKEIFSSLENIPDKSFKKLSEISNNLSYLGIPEDKYELDPTIVRGLGYYTGTVFETVLTDLPEVGTVVAGGRYDGLVEKFSSNKLPAVGMSIGIDRLFAALEKLGKIEKKKSTADVLVLNFDESCSELVQEITTDLRRNNIRTELYLGKEDTFKGQLAYAVSDEYPLVVIVGPKELEKGVAQIKDMKKRSQEEVKIESIAESIFKKIKA